MRIRDFKYAVDIQPSDLVFTIETTVASTVVRLPFYGADIIGMVPQVDWGDATGVTSINSTVDLADMEHTYATAGTYTVTVTATDCSTNDVFFYDAKMNPYLKTIEDFGWARLTSNAFNNCNALTAINATEIREVGLNASASGASFFKNCTALTTVADITYPFTDCSEMFSGCTALTNVGVGFNFSQATTCWRLFYNCSALTNAYVWDFSSCTTLEGAFYNAFDPVSSVILPANSTTGNVVTWTNCLTLCQATEIQALNFSGATDLSNFAINGRFETFRAQDFSTITNLNRAFETCNQMTVFEAPTFNTVGTYTMQTTFRDCDAMVNWPQLDTTNCTSFNATWYGCGAMTTAPMLDFTSATSLNSTFARCSLLDTVPAWNISTITEMGVFSIFDGTFESCNFTSIPNLDYSNVQTFVTTFSWNFNLTTVGSEFNATGAVTHDNTFASCRGLTSVTNFPMDNVTYINYTFYDCTSLTSFPNIDVTGCPTFIGLLANCTSITTYPTVDTSNCTSLAGMFSEMTGLTALPVVNTSSCTNFSFFFNRLTQFATIPDGYDFSLGTNFYCFMQDCHFTSLPTSYIGSFNEALDISSMFWRCDQLQSFPAYTFPKATKVDDTWRYCNNLAGDPFPTLALPQMTQSRDAWEFGMDTQSCTDMLNSLATNNLQVVSGETLDFGSSNYFTAQIGTSITDLEGRGWTIITGGGI